MLELTGRIRKKAGKEKWDVVEVPISLRKDETIVFVMDVWDLHWCKDVNERMGEIAANINSAVQQFRSAGLKILHMPGDTMDFYNGYPQRKKMEEEPWVKTSRLIYYGISHNILKYGFFPIFIGRDGGCPCNPRCKNRPVWTRQHPNIQIAEEDLIATNPIEVYSYLRNHGYRNIIYTGVHANICMLKRPTGIRKMKKLGFNCILCRDLTDVMYNPEKWPKVSHEEALELVVNHIEYRYCPTIVGGEFLA